MAQRSGLGRGLCPLGPTRHSLDQTDNVDKVTNLHQCNIIIFIKWSCRRKYLSAERQKKQNCSKIFLIQMHMYIYVSMRRVRLNTFIFKNSIFSPLLAPITPLSICLEEVQLFFLNSIAVIEESCIFVLGNELLLRRRWIPPQRGIRHRAGRVRRPGYRIPRPDT